jgi:hypothetical protein
MKGYNHLQPPAWAHVGEVVPVLTGARVHDVMVRVFDSLEHNVDERRKSRPPIHDVGPALALEANASSKRILDLCFWRLTRHIPLSDQGVWRGLARPGDSVE